MTVTVGALLVMLAALFGGGVAAADPDPGGSGTGTTGGGTLSTRPAGMDPGATGTTGTGALDPGTVGGDLLSSGTAKVPDISTGPASFGPGETQVPTAGVDIPERQGGAGGGTVQTVVPGTLTDASQAPALTVKPSDKGATGGTSDELNKSDDESNGGYTVYNVRVVGLTPIGIHQAVINGQPVTVVDYAPKYQVLRTIVIVVRGIKTPLRLDWADISAEQAKEYFDKGVPVPDIVKFPKDNKKDWPRVDNPAYHPLAPTDPTKPAPTEPTTPTQPQQKPTNPLETLQKIWDDTAPGRKVIGGILGILGNGNSNNSSPENHNPYPDVTNHCFWVNDRQVCSG